MYLEIAVIWAFACFLLVLLAEFAKKRIFGLFASVLILILGLVIFEEGLYTKTGEITEILETAESNGLGETTGLDIGMAELNGNITSTNTTINQTTASELTTLTASTRTTTYSYALITMPYFQFKNFMGVILLLGGLASFFYYIDLLYNKVRGYA